MGRNERIHIKKLNIILLILLSLLMIGSVSAASDTSSDDVVNQDISNEDNNHNTNTNDNDDVVAEASIKKSDTKSVNNEIKKEETNNKISSNKNKGDLLKDTNTPGTFSELQTNISATPNEGTLTLTKDYQVEDEFDEDGITIDGKTITIDGQGHTIDAQNKTRIFNITNAKVTIKNLKLINGKSDGEGGAIFINSSSSDFCTVTIINSTFTGNTASNGGAIGILREKENSVRHHYELTIINSTFTGNTANYGGAIGIYGLGGTGDIFYCILNIINSTFTGNTANGDGGAIGITDDPISDIIRANIISTTFTGNTANYGGAIHVRLHCSKEFDVNNTLFYDNNAQDGDGIYVELQGRGYFSVRNSVFIGDSCSGITPDSSSKTYDDGSFTALNARINTGNPNDHIIELTNNYTYNATRGSTDQDFIYGIPIKKDITIKGNGYTIDGSNEARIFKVTNGAQLKLINLTLTKGKGQDTYIEELEDYYIVGGAIYATDNCNITITDSKITHNNAEDFGGAIYTQNSQINITHTNINQNNATTWGGAIYTSKSHININNTNITQNNAHNGGAIYTNYNSHININNTNITNNNVTNSGGAIYADHNSQVNINNTNITQNNATYGDGGAIFACHDSIMVVSSSLFMGNTANSDGSAICGANFDNLTVNNNIFLNNTGNKEIYLYKDGNVDFEYNLDCNWFGNNETNMTKPDTVQLEDTTSTPSVLRFDNWLFLKATNTTDTVTVFSTSNITFKLCLYNSTTTADDKVFDYDNTQLYPINLNITSSKGTVDKKTAGLNETIKYNATESGKGSVTARIGSVSCTIELTNNKLPAKITVNNNTLDLKVDDTFKLIPTITPTGLTVTYQSNNESVVTVDNNGNVTAIGEGNAIITVKVGGDGVYAENSTTVTVNVKKIPTKIQVNNDKITLNVTDSVVSGATLDPSEAGSLTYTSNDSSVAKVVDGNIIGIGQGYANITVSYKGNNKYATATNKTILVTVNLKELTTNITNINIPSDLFEGKQYNVTGTLKVNDTEGFANQEIKIQITNKQGHIETYTGKTDSTGKFSITIRPQVNGEIDITINYPGNQTKKFLYKPVTKTQTQTVTLNKTSFKYLQQQITDAIQNNQKNLTLEWDYQYDEDTDYEFIKGININNEFTIYGNNHTINASGQARIFHVNKTGELTLDNITLCNGVGQDELINGEMVNVGGSIYAENNLTITNSILQDNEANKGSGIYIINGTLITVNTKFINSSVDGQNYTTKHKDSKLTIETIPDITEGNPLTIKISADPLFNDNVTININRNNYTVKIINGQGQISIPNLKPGTYTAKLIFKGNDNYTEINITSNSFKVNTKPVDPTPTPAPVGKQNTKILAKNKIYKPAKYRTYTVTVKNKKGKLVKNTKVQLRIGKKTYVAKTNKKGVATFKIPNKKSKKTKKSTKKSYKITATLNKNAKNDKLTLKMGSKKYNTKTNNNGKGTFKIKTTKKIRKYNITLKTTTGQAINKQKVTLKVNKKTYKATTNTKGKATFKINNLNKKGKYKAKITYNGNNNYNKSSKTVKITVKE